MARNKTKAVNTGRKYSNSKLDENGIERRWKKKTRRTFSAYSFQFQNAIVILILDNCFSFIHPDGWTNGKMMREIVVYSVISKM